MSRKNILCLFDVDGTLTKPRQRIAADFITFLENKVKPLASIGLVSGSDYSKVIEQMGGEHASKKFDYVFSENGLVYHQKGELKNQQSILNHLGEKKLQKVINYALAYLSTIELPAKRGNFIEFRTGMINISPVGRSCSQAEREHFALYDAEHKVRDCFVKELYKEFEGFGLEFAIGGQISIDVFPTGWDKTYCLNHVPQELFEEIHFFGDKTGPGGNDYEIFANERTIGHTVASPEHTQDQLTKLLSIA